MLQAYSCCLFRSSGKVPRHAPARLIGCAAYDCNHGQHVSATLALMATGLVYGQWKISIPCRINNTQRITKKFVTGDYVRDSYISAKFGANPSKGGGLCSNGWNITKKKYLYLFFGTSSTGHTHRQIFLLDASHNVDSRKGVPFGVSLILIPFSKSNPQKRSFWGNG